MGLFVVYLGVLLLFALTSACKPFVNELQYDNSGADTGEAVEVAALADTDLSGYQIVFYNGANGESYGSATLMGNASSDTGSWGFVFVSYAGIQNGDSDGLALVDPSGQVLEFISYEGTVTAVGGPADGLTSTDIGVEENGSTPVGNSLQRTGSGCKAADFTWQAPSTDSFGAINEGQSFVGCDCFDTVVNNGDVWINEIHYINVNADQDQGFEIAAPAGTTLSNWAVYLYEGKNNSKVSGKIYEFIALQDMPAGSGYAFQFYPVKIRDGKNRPAGLALVDSSGTVIEFISYGGTIPVTNGPAKGKISVDIGVAESSTTPVGESLQLIGSGSKANDFTWSGPIENKRGVVNTGQTIGGGGSTIFIQINEFHYDNEGTDVNEAVEVVAEAGADVSGWKIVFYNGNGGSMYDSITLSGTVSDAGNGYGFITEQQAGIQNGPDGIALVAPSNSVAEFLCYEGTFTATDGPANGQTCVDIGAAESGSTPTDFSLQKTGCGENAFWKTAASTFGAINDGQTLGSNNCPTTPVLKIYDIQGADLISSYEGDQVTVPGVVTALTSNGFFMQDVDGDGDDSTSDGILVFLNTAPSVSVGDMLNLTGIVAEFVPGSSPLSQPVTELTSASWSVISSGNSLPAPVVIGGSGRAPPTESIVAGIAFYESLEGMRVLVNNPLVVAPKSDFDEYWTVVDGGSGSSGLSPRGTITISENDFNPERIQIDYNSGSLSGFSPPSAETGDSLSSVTGVMSYSFGSYEVIATQAFTVTSGSLTRASTTLSKSSTNMLISTMNTLNLDPSDGSQFDALASVVVNNLASPGVIALQEVQDNDGATNSNVVSASDTLHMLVDAIVSAGGPTYSFVENTFIGDDTNGGEPGGNIRCSYLYLDSRVEFLSKDTVVDPNNQQTDPSNPFYNSRLPLVANFRSRQTSGEVQLVNVHFSSKGGSAPIFGTLQPFDQRQDEPDVNGNVDDRLAQANAVASYLGNSGAMNKVILGDCNEFQFNEPVEAMSSGFTILMNTLPVTERYSYNFEGNAQALDQILISDNLASGATFQSIHCNSEFSTQASDHDPLIVSLQI